MSIILSNDIPSYKQVDIIGLQNNDNIILNNNLILESDFINNGNLFIRGSIIFSGGRLINRGEIYLIQKKFIEYIIPFDLSGDSQATGLVVDYDIKNLNITVTNNSNNNRGKYTTTIDFTKESAFYFSNDGGLTSKKVIESGDELYWNESYSRIKIFKGLKIILQIL